MALAVAALVMFRDRRRALAPHGQTSYRNTRYANEL